MKSEGFRQIDTQYFKALMYADLTRSGYKILLVVIHFTLGYDQRDEAEISLGTFQELTGLSRPAVKTAIKELKAYKLISQTGSATNRQAATYKLNKDWRGKADLPSGGKADLPSMKVPEVLETYPPDAQNLPSRGQVPMPVTTPLKKKRKPLKKTTATSLEDYKKELRERFTDLDFDIELEKFNHYWSEGTRKLKRPKLSLLNWMLKARKIKTQEADRGSRYGAHRGSPRQLIQRDEYHLPGESEEEYRARMALKGGVD